MTPASSTLLPSLELLFTLRTYSTFYSCQGEKVIQDGLDFWKSIKLYIVMNFDVTFSHMHLMYFDHIHCVPYSLTLPLTYLLPLPNYLRFNCHTF